MDSLEREIRNVMPKMEMGRRAFAITTLASGFALSVMPVSAETIVTDAKGLVAGEVQIPVKDGQIPAYRAQPEGKGPFPTVIVIQEIFGVHEHMKDLCRRLAKQGYYAIAPSLYARQGDPTKITDIVGQLLPLVATVPDAQVMSDLDATVAFAKAGGSADTGRLAITGFCWGGRIVWLYAAHNPGVKAGAAWYGRVRDKLTDLQPTNPVDIAAKIKPPVLGLYAGKDTGIPLESVELMRANLKAAGSKSDILVYPDAQHGFNADYRPSYDATAAKDAWGKMLAWFKKNGVG